jgi:hypothetical protein
MTFSWMGYVHAVATLGLTHTARFVFTSLCGERAERDIIDLTKDEVVNCPYCMDKAGVK